MNCLALRAFAFGDCLVYLLWQWKLFEALGVRLYEWTGWLLVLRTKKGGDPVLERALHKKRPKGAYCFCLGIRKRRETGGTMRNTEKVRKDDLI